MIANDIPLFDHTATVKELERVVFSRLRIKGSESASCRIRKYKLNGDAVSALAGKKQTFMNDFSILNFNWKRENPSELRRGKEVECDLYVTIENKQEEETMWLLKDLLKDVVAESWQLSGSEEDISLNNNDRVWIDVAEAPELLRNKLWQLERALIAIPHCVADVSLPTAVVICVNGESRRVEEAIEAIRKVTQTNKKNELNICKTTCIIVRTPYRNTYHSLNIIDKNLNKIARSFDRKFERLEKKIQGLGRKVDEGLGAADDKYNKL